MGEPMTHFELSTEEFLVQQQKSESEEAFQARVVDLAHVYGWRVASFRPVRVQRANGSTYYQTPFGDDGVGFPDLLLVRDQVVYAELKAQNGILRPDQRDWRDALLAAGAIHYVWRPSDWPMVERTLGVQR